VIGQGSETVMWPSLARDFTCTTSYSLIMATFAEPGLGVEIDLVAIHSDQLQMLVDQSGSAIRIPRLELPSPLVVEGQTMTSRFSSLVAEKYGLRGQVLALSPGLARGKHRTIFLVFRAQDSGSSSDLDRIGVRWREISTLQELSDQDASAQLSAALNLVRARKISDDLKEAWSVKLSRVVQLLRDRMAASDGLIGWTQFLVGDSVGVLSTAQGILTFRAAEVVDADIRRNVETLLRLQNDDGGWPVRRALIGHSERSITESTTYCLWALRSSGAAPQDPAILRGIEWLERAQLKDGGWGSTLNPSRARIYPTAFATEYLAAATGTSTSVKRAINWLRDAQNSDGGWGPLKEAAATGARNSKPLHTARALLAILAGGAQTADTHVENGIRYLRACLRPTDEEPWPSTSEVEAVDEDAALDFRHFTTPWVICAFLKAGTPIGDPVVTAGVQWLLTEQHALGYWSSSLAPGQTPIWATFDAVYALSKVREAALTRISDLFDADSKSLELDFAWRNYFASIDELKITEKRARYRRIGWIYGWNAILTFIVVLILLYNAGPLSRDLSPVTKIVSALLVGLIPGFGPFVYEIILDHIKKRRGGESWNG
jgi:prenyltransferase beta subunit